MPSEGGVQSADSPTTAAAGMATGRVAHRPTAPVRLPRGCGATCPASAISARCLHNPGRENSADAGRGRRTADVRLAESGLSAFPTRAVGDGEPQAERQSANGGSSARIYQEQL